MLFFKQLIGAKGPPIPFVYRIYQFLALGLTFVIFVLYLSFQMKYDMIDCHPQKGVNRKITRDLKSSFEMECLFKELYVSFEIDESIHAPETTEDQPEDTKNDAEEIENQPEETEDESEPQTWNENQTYYPYVVGIIFAQVCLN